MTENERPQNVRPKADQWYDLFSRGARDWLRHNDKVRESVKQELPNLVAGADVISRPENRTVQVPVRFLEHARLRLASDEQTSGVGQGPAQPGDLLGSPREQGAGQKEGGGGNEGEVQFLLELKLDDIVDWLWEELKLPNLKPKQTKAIEDEEFVREGWDKRGARARLDRRRTLKEAVKRRAVQPDGPAFTDDDLRFRQLARRPRPATHAVVIFALDCSASMEEEQRRLAKTFFFWALQGLRRQHTRIDTLFIAHTARAWEFSEEEFFQVRGDGGTVASSAFRLSMEIVQDRYDLERQNIYLFYASDGENFLEDREDAGLTLRDFARVANFVGYVETGEGARSGDTEMSAIAAGLRAEGMPIRSYPLRKMEDIWQAIGAFFTDQTHAEEG